MANLEIMHKHIVKNPQIQGGRVIIAGTRIPVGDIVYWYKQGKDVHEILGFYPHLTLAQIHDALAYYYDQQEDLDREIKEYQAE